MRIKHGRLPQNARSQAKNFACGAKGLEKPRSYLGSYLPFSTANTQVVWFIPPIRRRRAGQAKGHGARRGV